FMACSGYPDCKQTLSLNPNGSGKPTGVNCPVKDCDGEVIEKTSRRGKIFYGCNRFPTCDFATWDKPVNKVCPGCGAGFMVLKTTKKEGSFLACLNQECGHRENLAESDRTSNTH
ncbi:MAG: type I DNA topoisomerase, partial [Desulfobacterales bacterium]